MRVLETKTIEIPEYPGSKVVMLKKAPWSSYSEVKPGMSEAEAATHILPPAIVEWNFDDQEGNPLDINKENIKRLPTDLVMALLKEIVTGATLKKKTSDE